MDGASTGLREFTQARQIWAAVHHDIFDISQILLHLYLRLDWLSVRIPHAADRKSLVRKCPNVDTENGGHANGRIQFRESIL